MKKIIVVILIVTILVGIGIVYYENNYDNKLVEIAEIKTDSKYENVVYEKEEEIEGDILGILEIKKIGLKAPVKEGSTSAILKDYVGHIESTPKYDGNVGLAAHNRGNEYSYFARLNELEVDDVIKYKTRFYERIYRVDNIQVIFETDLSILENTTKNTLTMVTCIANKRNQRLCVKAVEI